MTATVRVPPGPPGVSAVRAMVRDDALAQGQVDPVAAAPSGVVKRPARLPAT